MSGNKKNDIQFHETAKQASIASYKGKSAPGGYWSLDSFDNSKSGFHAEVFTNGKNIIIAYRGTNNPFGQDGRNDAAMWLKDAIPAQATDAIALYDEIKQNYPKSNIILTGHSLGVSLDQIVSAIRGVYAVTFNAYGTKDLFKPGTKLNEDNIINYVNENDGVSMINAANHIGDTYAVPGKIWESHKIEKMGVLVNRTYRSVADLERQKPSFN